MSDTDFRASRECFVVKNVPDDDLTTVVDAGLLLYDVPEAGLPAAFGTDEVEDEEGPLPPTPEFDEVVLVSPL